jgi:ABC-type antimicrobial peptide transport system permease subunit
MLAKSPGVTAIAIASLALGIGANTAIFTVAKAALFDALSIPHPEQLRLLAYTQDDRSAVREDWGDFYTNKQGRTVLASFSYPVYEKLQDRDHSLGDLVAFVDLSQFENLSATIDGHAEVVSAELVSGNFFGAMNVGTIVGRPIEPADDAVPGAGAVAVISDSFWQRRFDRSPSVIGKTVDINLTPVTIIGVTPQGFAGASRVHAPQDVFLPLSMQPVIFPQKTGSLLSNADTWWIQILGRSQYAWIRDDESPAFYVPYTQEEELRRVMTFEVRTKGNPKEFATAARSAVESIDKDLPLIDVRTQQEQIDAALASERSFAAVTSGFGLLALVLASIGVYGVMAAGVSRRVNEIGVRMALGAQANQVLGMVLGEAMALAFAGVGTGLCAALLLTRLLGSLLFGLKPTDLATLVSAALLLSVVAILASWGPARRASHIQPVQTLRHE